MSIQVGRRIIYDKTTGNVVVDFGEMQGEVLPRENIGGLDFIDLPYGQDTDKFSRVKKYHVDPATKTIIFDELSDPVITPEEQIATLQQELLQAQGVI